MLPKLHFLLSSIDRKMSSVSYNDFLESSRLQENMCYWSGHLDEGGVPFGGRRVQLDGKKVILDGNRENFKSMEQNPTINILPSET